MKKLLLISVLTLFATGVMFGQITVKVNDEATSRTGETLGAILAAEPAIAAGNVISLTFQTSSLKDEDIKTLRTLTNLAALDMEDVTLVPVGSGDPFTPTTPFINDAIEYKWTAALADDGTITVSCGITSDTQLPPHIFDGMTALKNVTIPSSVTSFGNYCFKGCTALETVNFPGSPSPITDLGFYAFIECTSLKSFDIPTGVTILNGTFMKCTNLESVTFPAGLTTIGGSAFARCTNFNLINGAIPSTVRNIGDYAFFKCENLTKIVLPEAGLTSLGGYAFDGCSSLVEVDNFEKISLGETRIEVKGGQYETVTQAIPSYLFQDCVNLETITFPENIGAVGGYAFINCEKLNSTITLSGNLKYVGYEAFANCKNLKFVPQEGGTLLPSSLTSIANMAFRDCPNFTGPIVYPSQVDNTIHHGVFWRSGVTGVTIPDGITTVEAHAFENTAFAETNKVLQIPGSVTFIGVGAFANNPGITNVVIAGGANRDLLVDEWAFNTLANLEEVDFGTGLQNITLKYHAFSYNKKTNKVVIPAGANVTVGVESFVENDKLALVEFGEGARVTDIDRAGFAGCLTLPNEMANRLIKDLTEIKEAIFFNCQSLTDIVIPSDVTKIDKDAFGGTISLKMITVSRSTAPETVTTGTRTWTNPDTHVDETIEVVTYPFGENTIPNQCMINFTGDARNNIASYRANTEFMRLLTKTLNEDVTEVNWVNQEGADVILERNFESTWSSFVVPFAYTQAQLEDAFGENTYAAEYTFWNETTGVFRFTVNTNGIGPNRPVLVNPKEIKSNNKYQFKNVNIVNPEIAPYQGASNSDKYKFTGTYVKKMNVIPANSYFVYKDHFISGGSYKNHSRGFRTWLEPTSNSAPSILTTMGFELEDEDNEVTAINAAEVFGPEAATTAKTYYSLDGSRVEHPSNGIYIVNGKKVVIK